MATAADDDGAMSDSDIPAASGATAALDKRKARATSLQPYLKPSKLDAAKPKLAGKLKPPAPTPPIDMAAAAVASTTTNASGPAMDTTPAPAVQPSASAVVAASSAKMKWLRSIDASSLKPFVAPGDWIDTSTGYLNDLAITAIAGEPSTDETEWMRALLAFLASANSAGSSDMSNPYPQDSPLHEYWPDAVKNFAKTPHTKNMSNLQIKDAINRACLMAYLGEDVLAVDWWHGCAAIVVSLAVVCNIPSMPDDVAAAQLKLLREFDTCQYPSHPSLDRISPFGMGNFAEVECYGPRHLPLALPFDENQQWVTVLHHNNLATASVDALSFRKKMAKLGLLPKIGGGAQYKISVIKKMWVNHITGSETHPSGGIVTNYMCQLCALATMYTVYKAPEKNRDELTARIGRYHIGKLGSGFITMEILLSVAALDDEDGVFMSTAISRTGMTAERVRRPTPEDLKKLGVVPTFINPMTGRLILSVEDLLMLPRWIVRGDLEYCMAICGAWKMDSSLLWMFAGPGDGQLSAWKPYVLPSLGAKRVDKIRNLAGTGAGPTRSQNQLPKTQAIAQRDIETFAAFKGELVKLKVEINPLQENSVQMNYQFSGRGMSDHSEISAIIYEKPTAESPIPQEIKDCPIMPIDTVYPNLTLGSTKISLETYALKRPSRIRGSSDESESEGESRSRSRDKKKKQKRRVRRSYGSEGYWSESH